MPIVSNQERIGGGIYAQPHCLVYRPSAILFLQKTNSFYLIAVAEFALRISQLMKVAMSSLLSSSLTPETGRTADNVVTLKLAPLSSSSKLFAYPVY